MTLPDGHDAWLRIERDFVDTLERCPRMREDSSRELIVEALGRRLGAELSVRRQTTARMNIMEVVHVCAGLPRGLDLLTDQIEFVDRLTPELPELRHLCDEWQAAHTLPDLWPELARILRPLRLPENGVAAQMRLLRKLAVTATEGRMQEPPLRCTTAWHLFVHLVGANAGPSGVPPYLQLLRCLADYVPNPTTARNLRVCCRTLAMGLDLTEQLDTDKPHESDDDETLPVHLIIQIDPDPMDADQLLVSHWRQWDPHEWRPQRGHDMTIAASELEAEVDNLIGGLETMVGASADAAKTEDIAIEFVLPVELLNFPVQHLRKKALASAIPLAVHHPVVIRSLERLRTPRLHLAWRRKWARISGKQARPYWSRPSGADYFVRLATELTDQHVFSLILSEPPEPDNNVAHLEVATALQAGIPAIMWHRRDCSSPEFRDAVTTMVADGALVQLPQRVAELRHQALRGGVASPSHPGWEIALLWDDPDRLLEPPRGIG